jgi:hypothetical protein
VSLLSYLVPFHGLDQTDLRADRPSAVSPLYMGCTLSFSNMPLMHAELTACAGRGLWRMQWQQRLLGDRAKREGLLSWVSTEKLTSPFFKRKFIYVLLSNCLSYSGRDRSRSETFEWRRVTGCPLHGLIWSGVTLGTNFGSLDFADS